MRKYQTILFDLDGTIIDSGIGVTKSAKYALNKFGINTRNLSELNRFIGPPLIDSFMKFCGFSREKALEAVAFFREYYSREGIWENTVYEGIPKLLKTLAESKKQVLLATSKMEVFARQILEKHGIAEYFDFIAGSDSDEKRSQKADVILYALKSCGIKDFSKTVMVGDTEYDVIGAKSVGIDSVGVLFGYGTRKELESSGAVFICDTVKDLAEFLL